MEGNKIREAYEKALQAKTHQMNVRFLERVMAGNYTDLTDSEASEPEDEIVIDDYEDFGKYSLKLCRY